MTDDGQIGVGGDVVAEDLRIDSAFTVFDHQDSGCLSYGITIRDADRFVKTATTPEATESLERCLRFHAAVRHSAIVRPVRGFRTPELTMVYPWVPGRVLNHATRDGSNRSALDVFRRQPTTQIIDAIDVVIEAHREVARQGFVAVDFYDGCLLYDFDGNQMRLIDLDEYRPGPFTVEADRLPGSARYMAPEEFQRGAVIDQRTTVHGLGRMIHHLLKGPAGWRGTDDQARVVERSTHPTPSNRFASVTDFAKAWVTANRLA